MCNLCRNGRTYFGYPCTNGCPFHVFPDGTALSFRYTKIKGDPNKDVTGDVWSFRLHRGRFGERKPGRPVDGFERTDDMEYHSADYPART